MARGYPDYFGQSIFPKYGEPKRIIKATDIDGGIEADLFEITGKGRIYGGAIYTEDTDASSSDTMSVWIDELEVFGQGLGTSFDQGWAAVDSIPAKLVIYDTIAPRFAVRLAPDITFETSFKCTYNPLSANRVRVIVDIFYSLIT